MDQSEHCKEVYAYFGLALYHAQVLEQAIVQALMFLDLIPSSVGQVRDQEDWEEKFDSFFEQEQKKTLGRLLGRLRSLDVLDGELDTGLDLALRRRNWLAHHYFRENAENFMNRSGRERMIEELIGDRDTFQRAEELLNAAMEPVCSRYGLTAEKWQEITAEYIEDLETDL